MSSPIILPYIFSLSADFEVEKPDSLYSGVSTSANLTSKVSRSIKHSVLSTSILSPSITLVTIPLHSMDN